MFINRKWKWCGQFGWVVEIWIRHMKWANNKWEAKSQGFCAEQTFYSDHNNGDKIIWLYTKTKLVRSGYARYTSTDTTCVHETDLSNFIKSFITKQRRQIKQQFFFSFAQILSTSLSMLLGCVFYCSDYIISATQIDWKVVRKKS